MANTKNPTSRRQPKAVPKPAVETTEIMNEQVENIEAVQPTHQIVVRKLDPTMYVTVRNGFNGMLVYRSNRTGEVFTWADFGTEQEMELQELKNAKNNYKVFFENNWFLIDDQEVIEYLGLERFYRNALSYDEFDDLFTMTPSDIASRIALLSEGQKASVRYRARKLIADGVIDSLKVIDALEKSLDVELIEH